MDLEDFFTKKERHYHNQYTQNYYRGGSKKYNPYHHDQAKFNLFEFVASIRNNKKLRIVVLAVLVILVVIVIGFIALLLPLIGNSLNFIFQNGVDGIIDMVMDFLHKLWHGTNE